MLGYFLEKEKGKSILTMNMSHYGRALDGLRKIKGLAASRRKSFVSIFGYL